MIIHFTTKSTNAIRAWFRRNGFTCGCGLNKHFFNDGFVYDGETHRVEVPEFYIASAVDDELLMCLKNKGLTTETSWLVATILHELGHAETIHLFTESELKKVCKQKQKLSDALTEANRIQINRTYWNLPVEDIANNWAITYANMFPHKVDRLYKILQNNCTIAE